MISALFFVVMTMAAAFTLQSADLYVTKLRSQRSADLANLAAALTSSPVINNAASPTAIATALNVAAINGFGPTQVATTTAPGANGTATLSTRISLKSPLLFGALISTASTSSVGSTSSVAVNTTMTGACLASLTGPIILNLSTSVQGDTCSVSAAAYLNVILSSLKVLSVTVGFNSFLESPWVLLATSLSPTLSNFSFNGTTVDTLASNPSIIAIKSHLAAMSSWPYGNTSPVQPSYPAVAMGMNVTYTNTAAVLLESIKYGSVSISGSTLVFTGYGASDSTCNFPTTISGNVTLSGTNSLTFNSGCYVFAGTVSGQAGTKTSFSIAPGAIVNFVFKQAISNSSGTISFGNATYSFGGDVNNASSGSLSFGNGSKVFGGSIINGSGSLTFGDGPYYVDGGLITNGSGTAQFGNGPFYIWGGTVTNALSGTLKAGNGPFYFYNGSLINVGGTLTLGNGPFYFHGGSLEANLNCTNQFGVGNMDFYGGSILLNGGTTTFGYGGASDTGSSMISLNGGSFQLLTGNLTATGVTFALSIGLVDLFGTGTINITAPTAANATYGYQNVLFAMNYGLFNFLQINGQLDTFSGMIYSPQSLVQFTGPASLTYPSGSCLGIIAGSIDILQSIAMAIAPCPGLTASSVGSSVSLLQ